MVKDQAFLDDAGKIDLDISPIDGEAVRQLIARGGGDAEGRDRALQSDWSARSECVQPRRGSKDDDAQTISSAPPSPCRLRRWRCSSARRDRQKRKRSSNSTRAARSPCSSRAHRAASTISTGVSSRRILRRYIPGNPNIVPENLPGASGVVIANRLYNTSERDGSVIAIIERAVPQLAVQGDPTAKFDPLKMVWLGSLSSYANDAYILAVNSSSPVHSVDDLKSKSMSVQIGAMNPGTTNLTFAILSKELLGLNLNIVRGYSGAAPMFLAMQQRRSRWPGVRLQLVEGGPAGALARSPGAPARAICARSRRLPELADVPTGRELIKDPKDLALLAIRRTAVLHGRPLRRAARSAGRPRQGLAGCLHGDDQGSRLSRRRAEAEHRYEPDRRRRPSASSSCSPPRRRRTSSRATTQITGLAQ